MIFGTSVYYMTMRGPHRGERVVASIETDDPAGTEKLLGCGLLNEKGFGFNGLYSEEEVRHMFRPGTEIPGTMDTVTGQAEYHRDYRKVSVYACSDGKLYRICDGEQFLLDVTGNEDFDTLRKAMAKKFAAAKISEQKDSVGVESAVDKKSDDAVPDVFEEPNIGSAADSFDFAFDEPEFVDELESADEKPEQQSVNVREDIKPLPKVYDVIDVSRTPSKSPDAEYISTFDSAFYRGHSAAKREEEQGNGSSDKTSDAERSVRGQGQSLKDLFSGGIGADEFHV